jgi:hypothetical protein
MGILTAPNGVLTVEREEGFEAGDAVRLSRAGARTLTAGPAGAEVLIWETA